MSLLSATSAATATTTRALSLSSSFILTHKSHFLSPTPLSLSSSQPPEKKRRRAIPFRCNALLSDLAPATSAVYGTLLLGGGLFAYVRSGSKGSIIGGASGAALMAAAYYLMQSPETKVAGDALGFGSAFLFSAVFGIRLVATQKPVPAGPLLGLSLGALVVFISVYLQDKI